MINNRMMKIVSFAICVVVFVIVSASYLNKEKQFCMEVPIISAEEASQYTEIKKKTGKI